MTLKIKYSASEYDSDTGEQALQPAEITRRLVDYKVLGLTKRLLIPDDLIAEMESYISRNSFKKAFSQFSLDMPSGCCIRCLKAHMVKKAEEHGLTRGGIKFLSSFLDGEAGHYGYYLDGEDLIKL